MSGWSLTLDRTVFIATRCGSFSCPHCGPKKQQRMAIMCELAAPNKLITLTVNPRFYKDPRDAFDQTRRQLSQLAKTIRLERGEFEYLRVIEATKAGWPHYHLVARTPYVPQATLSRAWRSLTKAPVVDIRKIDERLGVFGYVFKYLGKQVSIPWTKRRISWTRNFFQKAQRDDNPGLQLELLKFHKADLAATFVDSFPGALIERFGTNVFIIKERCPPGPPADASP